ncbi:MAG: endonuclease/exonuclease/phosphatase family protein [Chloroflexota bacterium]|nr:endonuclease/exonuclease/phosphatase family protein [Chloroflexota bacterium]
MAKSGSISWFRRITASTVLLYATLVAGWYVAYRLTGDDFWWLAMINSFAVYLFAPLPLILLLAVLARRRVAWLALLVIMLPFLSLFGSDLTPPSPVVRAGNKDPALTVMTYNVLYAVTDAAPAAVNITSANPDIIAFQELTPLLARQLEQEIGARYPYRTPLHPAACHAEVAVWSRYPLQVEDVDEDVLCRVRPVVVSFDGRLVRVVDIHAWPFTGLDQESVERSFRWRQEQIEMVLNMVEGQPEPLVLLGDLNSTPTHEVHRTLSTHLVDAHREAGWGLGHTYPATDGRLWGIPYPDRLVRIDHIFHSDEWRAEAAWVGEWDGSSDHRAVVARLRLPHTD